MEFAPSRSAKDYLPGAHGCSFGSPNQQLAPLTARADGQDRLEIGGCAVTELVRELGSPLYVVDEASFRVAASQYREAFARHYPGPSRVLYASKAWSCLALCALAASEGLGIDAVSGGELHTALAAGVDPGLCYLHGNNKAADELRLAVESGCTVIVDNRHELEELAALASAAAPVSILLRFTPGIGGGAHHAIRTGHEDSKFGFASAEMAEILDAVRDRPGLRFAGFHAHLGSQICELGPYRELAGLLVRWMGRAAERGLETRWLDVGGGLGIRYTEADEPPGVDAWVRTVAETVVEACLEGGRALPGLIAEPGRSLVGPAGITAYTVGGRKDIPGLRSYLSVDGGMSDNPRSLLYGAVYRALIADRVSAPFSQRVTVVGKHCESGDVLIADAPLPDARPGETLVVLGTGAYNYSMSSNYNRIPRPAAVLARGGEAELIVARETWQDLARHDRLPARLSPASGAASPPSGRGSA